MNNHNLAKDQANAIENKATYWRGYLQECVNELHRTQNYTQLRAATLWASTFAYIEWLLVFDVYHTSLTKDEITDSLNRHWGWDKELSALFWEAGRHPIAHVGQTNSFHSYYKYNNLPTNVTFDFGKWSKAVTDNWGKYNTHRGVTVPPELDTQEGPVQVVAFFHQMILEELLPELAKNVAEKIRLETDTKNLNKILKLNIEILH